MFADVFDQNTFAQQREETHLKVAEYYDEYEQMVDRYRVVTLFNLCLIMTIPLQRASQSLKFRSFLRALAKSFKSLAILSLMMALFCLSVLFYGL